MTNIRFKHETMLKMITDLSADRTKIKILTKHEHFVSGRGFRSISHEKLASH